MSCRHRTKPLSHRSQNFFLITLCFIILSKGQRRSSCFSRQTLRLRAFRAWHHNLQKTAISRGDVHAVIPLYAVGVFLGFSLSQLGMIVHWLREGPGHRKNIAINALGFAATASVFVIVFLFKFLHGAWILVPAVFLLVAAMQKIRQHYLKVARVLALQSAPVAEVMPDKTAVLLISELNRGTLYALKLARSFNPTHIHAVHVCIDEKEGEELRRQWKQRISDVPIEILYSEYRDLIRPILKYLKEIDRQYKNDSLIVFIPQVALSQWWHFFLHNQTSRRIQLAIEQDPDINPDIYEVSVKAPSAHGNI